MYYWSPKCIKLTIWQHVGHQNALNCTKSHIIIQKFSKIINLKWWLTYSHDTTCFTLCTLMADCANQNTLLSSSTAEYRHVQHIDRRETRMYTLTISLLNRDWLCYEKNDRRAWLRYCVGRGDRRSLQIWILQMILLCSVTQTKHSRIWQTDYIYLGKKLDYVRVLAARRRKLWQ